MLVVYLWALGGLLGLWTRTGGAVAFARWAGARIVRGPRSARFFVWLVGMLFHQGGTISTILAGTTVRPVTDANRVSHEETTYLVDSTASPAATVIPFNAWPLYVAGLVVGTTPLFATVSGAHLYGFPSADSDWDLRGAHLLPVRELVGLERGPETLEVSGDAQCTMI